jgi:hypothetical protein
MGRPEEEGGAEEGVGQARQAQERLKATGVVGVWPVMLKALCMWCLVRIQHSFQLPVPMPGNCQCILDRTDSIAL